MTVPITFLRIRPAEGVGDAQAGSRRQEGTTCLEGASFTATDLDAIHSGGLLSITSDLDCPSVAWVLAPDQAVAAGRKGIPGWRITVADNSVRSDTLDGIARSNAAYLRTGRSQTAAAAEMVRLPAINTVVSVFVDDVDQAMAAVVAGAGDLLLRDWDAERIGELRDRLGDRTLIERSALPPGVEIDQLRTELAGARFTAWLGQVDGSGTVRPRYTWAPGKEEPLPTPPHRLSAQWADSAWRQGASPEGLDGAGDLRPILERSLAGERPTRAEVEDLFRARGNQVDAIAWVADRLRSQAVGETATYVVNRNINYTNLCYFKCGFCAFSKGSKSLNLRGEPYLMGIAEIVDRAKEAWDRGATEVTLQGGIHPDFTGNFYAEVVEAIKAELPEMHIHGFTPLEVWQGAATLGVTVREFLTRLGDAGLGTLPGTAAEILDDEVRRHLCPDKITTAEWAEVMITAHEVGLRATSTIMFGHIDHPRSWANHLEVIRQIQRRTGGFTEMVPLGFVHMASPIFQRGLARPGPTWDEVVLIHAVSRIALDGLVDNIQGSWVKLGLDGAARLLGAGTNDLGGTLMGEIITRSAGASHGEEMAPAQFEEAIRGVGRVPARRDTLYATVERV